MPTHSQQSPNSIFVNWVFNDCSACSHYCLVLTHLKRSSLPICNSHNHLRDLLYLHTPHIHKATGCKDWDQRKSVWKTFLAPWYQPWVCYGQLTPGKEQLHALAQLADLLGDEVLWWHKSIISPTATQEAFPGFKEALKWDHRPSQPSQEGESLKEWMFISLVFNRLHNKSHNHREETVFSTSSIQQVVNRKNKSLDGFSNSQNLGTSEITSSAS